jgi:cytochrome c peroxidase
VSTTIRARKGTYLRVLFLLSAVFGIVLYGSWLFATSGDENLINKAKAVFGPLPSSMASPDNPITPEKVKLGNALFWETRISVDGTVSCVRCHPIGLYAADGLKKPIGNHCKENPRNAPTIFNAASQISEHWIGNRTSVEDQAKQALIGPPSFGMPSYGAAEKVLNGLEGYVVMFKAAFPGDKAPVTVDNLAKAIGAFERTLVTPAPFDEFIRGNAAVLSSQQKRGLQSFMEVGCSACHMSPYVGGQMYQKFGVYAPYWTYTKSQPVDEGRFAVTKNPADKYVFKVPVLRNVAKTSPYFHDGSVDRLEDAVVIMAKVQLMKDLTKEQASDLVAFLGALTGTIPDAAARVPLLPPA